MKTNKINVLYFTDPYCSWCWATEPALIAMQEKYREQIEFQYVFGGLVKDMTEFYDAQNDIGTAAAVVPHWRMVSERSGQPIEERLWEDIGAYPHFSTWPANIAAKAAFIQGKKPGEKYLRRLRRAALTERKIISHEEVYLPLASEIEGLDFDKFEADLKSGKAYEAFTEDLKICRKFGVSGFPTMLFYKTDADLEHLGSDQAILVGGHRSMETYDKVIATLEKDIKKYAPRKMEELIGIYGPLTSREIGQIYSESTQDADADLRKRAELGDLVAVELRGGILWSTPGNPVLCSASEPGC